MWWFVGCFEGDDVTGQRRYRRGVQAPEGALKDAARAQREMHEAIGERSRVFLAAADAGHSMRAIAEATGMSVAMVHRIVVAEEQLRDGGYVHVPKKRFGSLAAGVSR